MLGSERITGLRISWRRRNKYFDYALGPAIKYCGKTWRKSKIWQLFEAIKLNIRLGSSSDTMEHEVAQSFRGVQRFGLGWFDADGLWSRRLVRLQSPWISYQRGNWWSRSHVQIPYATIAFSSATYGTKKTVIRPQWKPQLLSAIFRTQIICNQPSTRKKNQVSVSSI